MPLGGSISALCEACSAVDWEILRTPHVSDLGRLDTGQVDQEKRPFKRDGDETNCRFLLGKLLDIIRKSSSCVCCGLVWRIIGRRNDYTSEGTNTLGEEITVYLNPSFWGYIKHPPIERPFARDTTWMYRMNILTSTDDSSRGSWDNFVHAFQVGDLVPEAAQTSSDDTEVFNSKLLYSSRIRPLCINTEWLKQWLDICDLEHRHTCIDDDQTTRNFLQQDTGTRLQKRKTRKISPLVRFIDVENKAVKTFRNVFIGDIRYIALSYVWGSTQRLKLTTANSHQLAETAALEILQPSQTIVDAILLTEKLSIPYIWVDALCIIQDDDNDKAVQIPLLADIYRLAYVTFIAASGSHADSGLPGVRPGTRSEVQGEFVVGERKNGNTFRGDTDAPMSIFGALRMPVAPLSNFLEGTPWFERGWTLQERAVSPRIMAFTSEQVYWVCTKAWFCEDTRLEVSELPLHPFETFSDMTVPPIWREPNETAGPEERYWDQYNGIILKYTSRVFSYNGDIYDGFSAVQQMLEEESGDRLLWGFPCSRFGFALSWWTTRRVRERTETSTLPMTSLRKNVRFPSWSWMGWVGQVSTSVGDSRVDAGDLPEITCYVHKRNPLRFIKVADLADGLKYSPPVYARSSTPLTMEWRIEEDAVVSAAQIRQLHGLKFDLEKGTLYPDEYLIFFWTSTAKFEVTYEVASGGAKRSEPWHRREDASVVGCNVNRLQIKDGQGNVAGSACGMFEVNRIPEGDATGLYNFVVVGRRQILHFEPVLIALQVEYRDGVAYRKNIAEIAEKAWVQAEPKWALIVLA